MNIYVGNISRDATEADIREAFEEYGEVASVSLIRDRYTGQFRGFGFVEMPDSGSAKTAIAELDGKNILGRPLTVSEAKPRTERRENRPRTRNRY